MLIIFIIKLTKNYFSFFVKNVNFYFYKFRKIEMYKNKYFAKNVF